MVAAKLSSNSAILAPVIASSAMYAVAIAVPCHVPVPIVPTAVICVCDASTLNVLVLVKSPPPERPVPLAISTEVWFICSLATGYITALIAASHHMKIVLSTSILILIFGVVMQILSWNTMPVWYHITVLGSLAPLIYLGGTGRIKRL